jgi:hypothetical protein
MFSPSYFMAFLFIFFPFVVPDFCLLQGKSGKCPGGFKVETIRLSVPQSFQISVGASLFPLLSLNSSFSAN